MPVREATLNDKEKWNTFVETQDGSMFHYFDWKNIYEVQHWHYIPLLFEDTSTEIIGILPLVKIHGLLYSKLISLPEGASGGFVFKKGLPTAKKAQVMNIFLHHIEQHYSKGCSTFTLKENLSVQDATRTTPTELFIKNGFTFHFDNDAKLPCTYLLQLTPSFEEGIWNGLWGKYLRNHIRKSQKKGVHIREETNLDHNNDIITMFLSTYKRFGSLPISAEEITLRLTTFNDKTKVWVAFLNDTPIASLICYNLSSICYASKMVYDDSARENHATALLFYEAIRDACKNGYQFFEFGVTVSSSLAYWKEQFMPLKIPMRIYEKRYSTLRTFFERTSQDLKWAWNNKSYVWHNRRQLIREIIRKKM
ncbi:MAG: GNAT family N-acetyltransferase [Thermoplasmata archaeon]|nr:GNAT family N-acetyltransferase [Thermoplasmata archaeon]